MTVAVALAYTESRYSTRAVSRAGALGPLQVLPQWHCPGRKAKGCDLVEAGVKALARYGRLYAHKPGGWHTALCHWNAGNRCTKRGRWFARRVMLRASGFLCGAMGGTCATP